MMEKDAAYAAGARQVGDVAGGGASNGSGVGRKMTPEAAQAFLHEAARYFRNRDTKGDDSAHWSNVYNAENCEIIAEMICGVT